MLDPQGRRAATLSGCANAARGIPCQCPGISSSHNGAAQESGETLRAVAAPAMDRASPS
jgi:hypothetical protein